MSELSLPETVLRFPLPSATLASARGEVLRRLRAVGFGDAEGAISWLEETLPAVRDVVRRRLVDEGLPVVGTSGRGAFPVSATWNPAVWGEHVVDAIAGWALSAFVLDAKTGIYEIPSRHVSGTGDDQPRVGINYDLSSFQERKYLDRKAFSAATVGSVLMSVGMDRVKRAGVRPAITLLFPTGPLTVAAGELPDSEETAEMVLDFLRDEPEDGGAARPVPSGIRCKLAPDGSLVYVLTGDDPNSAVGDLVMDMSNAARGFEWERAEDILREVMRGKEFTLGDLASFLRSVYERATEIVCEELEAGGFRRKVAQNDLYRAHRLTRISITSPLFAGDLRLAAAAIANSILLAADDWRASSGVLVLADGPDDEVLDLSIVYPSGAPALARLDADVGAFSRIVAAGFYLERMRRGHTLWDLTKRTKFLPFLPLAPIEWLIFKSEFRGLKSVESLPDPDKIVEIFESMMPGEFMRRNGAFLDFIDPLDAWTST